MRSCLGIAEWLDLVNEERTGQDSTEGNNFESIEGAVSNASTRNRGHACSWATLWNEPCDAPVLILVAIGMRCTGLIGDDG